MGKGPGLPSAMCLYSNLNKGNNNNYCPGNNYSLGKQNLSVAYRKANLESDFLARLLVSTKDKMTKCMCCGSNLSLVLV